MRWINFDPVLGLDQYTSSGIQYYYVSKIKQYGWLIYSWSINEFEKNASSLDSTKHSKVFPTPGKQFRTDREDT